MADSFRWDPAARLFGPDGTEQRPEAAPRAVIAEVPGPAALAAAFAASEAGTAFRIGAPGLPPPAPGPGFETLTSGSTGTPRRIRRSPASWTESFAVNAHLFGIGPGATVAIPGALSQSLALYGAVEALHSGATLHLLHGLRPDRMAAELATRAAGLIYATPAQLRLLIDAGRPAPALRQIICGGAKLDAATREGIAALYPQAALSEFYGTSEASFITLSGPGTPQHAVGRAYPGVEIDLVGPPGAGEVRVRSPYLFEGYASDPGAARWCDGWLSTGEVARWDGADLVLLGRLDRMVTVADQNVFPEEVEAFLLRQPGVTRAAVLPRPDPRRGHVLEAVVEGGEDGAILSACRKTLGPLKAPRRLHRLADWPLLPSGKTDLAALQMWLE